MEFFDIDISVSKKTLFLFFTILGILISVSFISKKVYAGGQWIPCDSSHYCQSYGGYYCYSDGWTTNKLQCSPSLVGDTCYYNGACNSSTGDCSYSTESCPLTKISLDGDTCYYDRSCTDSGCVYNSADTPKPSSYYRSGSTCYYGCSVVCTTSGWTRGSCSSCSLTSYCVGDTRYYNGACTSTGCSFSSEDCNKYDGWYNYGDSGPGCSQLDDPTVEYRDYSCSAGSCVYTVTQTKDCDSLDGWYDGGDNPGCGDDPSSQQRDYYATSSGTCIYTTTNCGTKDCDYLDVCSNVCENNKIYSYKDYYVIENSNTCSYNLGSLVEDCLTKQSTDSDGGDKPFVKGTVTDYTGCNDGDSSCSYNTYTDYCSGDTLTEYIASGSSYTSKTYDCNSYDGWYSNSYRDYYCSNGACDYTVVCVDNTPPTTTASATANGNPYSFGTWTKYDVTVTLSASDDCWVDKTYYCVDSSNSCNPTTEYTSPFTVSCASGSVCTKYVRFYSTDDYGRSESIKSVTIRIDKTTPLTTINPNGYSWTNQDVSFTLSCSDTGSGCDKTYYKIIDDGQTCGSTGYTQGNSGIVTCDINQVCEKRVCYYSVDVAGNQESVKQSNIFYIDKSKPSCSASITESSSYAYVKPTDSSYVYYNSNGTDSFTVSVSASDTGSGVDRVIFPTTTSNGGIDYTQPYQWTYSFDSSDTYEGPSTITVYDKAGNSNTCSFFVDRDVAEPTTIITVYDNNALYNNDWVNHDLKFDIKCYDSESGCKQTYYTIVSYYDSCPTTISSYTLYASANITVSCANGNVCEYKVCAFSIDNVNNNRDLHLVTTSNNLRIDKRTPTGTIDYVNTKTGVVNDIISSVDKVRFIVNADDYYLQKSGLYKVEFYVNGKLMNGTTLNNALIYTNDTLNGIDKATVYSIEIGPFDYNQMVTYYAKIYDIAGNVYETPHEAFNVIFGVNCGGSTRITMLTTWNASSEVYQNSGGVCGMSNKVNEIMHNFPEDPFHGRFDTVSLTIYNYTDVIAYTPNEDYCVWIDRSGNYACHEVGKVFKLDDNTEINPRDLISERIATCIKGTGVANDNPVLVSSSEVPNGFVFLPSNENYFHVKWNVNYSTNPREVGVKCYFNPHWEDSSGHIYWCTFDEIDNGVCKPGNTKVVNGITLTANYQLCKCSNQWPCYQNTKNQTIGTCTVEDPKYLVNVTGYTASGWPRIEFVENKIFCKFYDPNFENESYTWYNHNFNPISFEYEFTLPNNTQVVVGSLVPIKLKIINRGVIEDVYNITAISSSPALSVTPAQHETASIASNDFAEVLFSLIPNYALSSTPVTMTFRICSEKMESVLPEAEANKACKEHTIKLIIKMITMDDNPIKWLLDRVFN